MPLVWKAGCRGLAGARAAATHAAPSRLARVLLPRAQIMKYAWILTWPEDAGAPCPAAPPAPPLPPALLRLPAVSLLPLTLLLLPALLPLPSLPLLPLPVAPLLCGEQRALR